MAIKVRIANETRLHSMFPRRVLQIASETEILKFLKYFR